MCSFYGLKKGTSAGNKNELMICIYLCIFVPYYKLSHPYPNISPPEKPFENISP